MCSARMQVCGRVVEINLKLYCGIYIETSVSRQM